MSEEPVAAPEAAPPPRSELWRLVLWGVPAMLGLYSILLPRESASVAVGTGVAAILLGIIWRVVLRRTAWHAPGAYLAYIGIAFGATGTLCTILTQTWLIPHERSHSSIHRAICESHLLRIGVGLRQYAESHDGVLPDKLSALYPEYVSETDVFICGASGNEPGDPAHLDEWCDYTYVPNLRATGTRADWDVLVCYDSEYHHAPKTRNELYLSGRTFRHRQGKPHQPSNATRP